MVTGTLREEGRERVTGGESDVFRDLYSREVSYVDPVTHFDDTSRIR